MNRVAKLFKEKLPKYNHLKKIRDRLWKEDGKSRVSVMVGAGFSLNANKLDDSLESLSTWEHIENKISEALNPFEISSDDNVLDISEKYVQEYGRESLDTLLKQAIPDQNYEPGEIHQSLLKLPWSDVYTTNYDTLLERTLPQIIERNYQVIYDIRDIPNSASPRIVKLHGSFPSNRPFIFTKSDFKSYKEQFAPLVNMVQQSIMETTFVLIGFSGEDPNFETWTRWVHENLGEHRPRIYMLAYDEEERKDFLHDRGITLIDFREVYKDKSKKGVYKQMFEDIFQYLSFKEKKEERDWPFESYLVSDSDSDKLLNTFIKNRKSYPGWLIMPDVIRKEHREHVQFSCDELKRNIANNDHEISKRISSVNELIWVYDIFQIPIDFHFHELMKKLVDEVIDTDSDLSIEKIVIRLIKESRLDYNENEFNRYVQLLENSNLSKEALNRLVYEKALMKKSKFEYNKVENLLNEWKVDTKDFEWLTKKAVLFSEIGKTEKAIKILESNLATVRKIIAIKNNNLRLLSIEGIILALLLQLNRNSYQNIKERLLTLESRLCNPLKELDFMFSRIKPYEDSTGVSVKKTFDPNRVTRSVSYRGTLDMSLIDSYSMLITIEEYGLRLTATKKNAIHIAIKNLEKFYPFYSWLIYIQMGDIKEVDQYFSRNVIGETNRSSMSLFAEIVVNGVLSKQNTRLLLEVLSRIYFALEKSKKVKVDKLVLELFKSEEFHRENRWHIKEIFESLFRRILFDKNIYEKGAFISEIYKTPIIGDPDGSLSEIKLEGFEFYDPSFEFSFSDYNVILKVDPTEVRRLQKKLREEKSSVRDASLKRLTYLMKTNNLEKNIEEEIRMDIANIIKKENSGYSDYLLESFLVSMTNDSDLQKRYSRNCIQKSIPQPYEESRGVRFSKGNALKDHLNNLANIFPNFINEEKRFKTVTNDMYISCLSNFFDWWKSQEQWLLSENNDSWFGESDDLDSMITFLKNSLLINIPVNILTSSDKEKIEEIYLKLHEKKYHKSQYLIPTLIRIGILNPQSIDKIAEGLMNTNIDLIKSSSVSFYDLVMLEKKGELEVDLSQLKSIILNLFIYRKEASLSEVTKSLGLILKNAPDFFNEKDLSIIVTTLNLILDDIKNDYYDNILVKYELLSNLARLAGEIYNKGIININEKLELWRVFIKEHRMPEVRNNIELFESELNMLPIHT